MDFDSGKFGCGGDEILAAELLYRGTLGASFIEFAVRRANRLSLTGWIRQDPEGMRVTIQGPQAMVDSFEIVCSLGPIDAEVQTWDRRALPATSNQAGFEHR